MFSPQAIKRIAMTIVIAWTLLLSYCAIGVGEAMKWDHDNKCATGNPPVDKKPCENNPPTKP